MEQISALELPLDLEWLNADPQSLSIHSGRVIVLLFWNASSVYSHNALLDLLHLQHKYPESLSALAIHIPKFKAELDNKFVSEVISRLDVQLPVANDKSFSTWQSYGIESWPTFVIIDHNGFLVDKISGDMQFKLLESTISGLAKEVSSDLKNKTKTMQVHPKTKFFGVLNNPCGLLFNNGLLYIADTGNNRILECTVDGHIKRVFGNGLALNMDGIASEAAFNRPVGLCLARDHLYVADTGNHAIRRVRLLDGVVDTLLGDGKAGTPNEQIVSVFHEVQLNNPTAVSVIDDILILADSGNNSLWMFSLISRKFSLLAGSSKLGLVDGIGSKAELAHPLAISGSKNYLYLIEGSSSSIRTVAVPEGRVNTLVGHGLFKSGSSDGMKLNASLQHPSSLAVDENRGLVWIADSYNRKIRILNITNNALSNSTMPSHFVNPSALSLGDDSLWIADSGANYIYRYYIATDYIARITILP